MDWTATGTMLLAFFTLLLFGTACWAGWEARKSAKAAWESLKEERRRTRQAQANRVYSSPVKGEGNAAHLVAPGLTVKNGSDLPIYDVVAVIEPRYSVDEMYEHTNTPEWDWIEKNGGISEELRPPKSTIMPGDQQSLYVLDAVLTLKWGWTPHDDNHGNRYYTTQDHIHGPVFNTRLRFRDASNQTWQRDPEGILSEVLE